MRDEGIISGTLNARTVLKLFQSLTNDKFLYYPKYKGYQAQLMLFYPFKYQEGEKVAGPWELILTGVYGIPVGYKSGFIFSGSLSKAFNLEDSYNFPFQQARNILQLSLDAARSEIYNPDSYLTGYISGDYQILVRAAAFHKFTPFFGIRGNLGLINSGGKFQDQEYTFLSQNANLDYAILSRLILSAGVNEYFKFQGGEVRYYITAETRISYIIF